MRKCAVRTARALLAVAVSGLCLLLGSLVGLVLLPSPAAATEPVASVAITLTTLNPELPTRDDEITVTGRVTNITKERLYRLEALFWRHQAPISGRAGLEQALASESNDPLGALARIYEQLELSGFATAAPHFRSYLEKLGTFTKNQLRLEPAEREAVRTKLAHVYKRFGYT